MISGTSLVFLSGVFLTSSIKLFLLVFVSSVVFGKKPSTIVVFVSLFNKYEPLELLLLGVVLLLLGVVLLRVVLLLLGVVLVLPLPDKFVRNDIIPDSI